jgi:hypothetical protein
MQDTERPHRRRCELQLLRPQPSVFDGLNNGTFGAESGALLKIRVETSAAAAEMIEDSHLPAWSAALPQRFRQHRLPRREVLRPVENELPTAGNATVGDAEMHFTAGVEKPELHWHFGQRGYAT